ncbi:MAG: hypothetical protein PHU21_05220 [Elusimicrobia bacterium]|nr:hypothetical protein [Elusimicrobiota bacterium]
MRPLCRLLLCLLLAAQTLQAAPAPPAAPQDPKTAEECVDFVCANIPLQCLEARSILIEAEALDDRMRACVAPTCPLKTLDSISSDASALKSRYFDFMAKVPREKVIWLFTATDKTTKPLKKLYAQYLSASLSYMETELSRLESETFDLVNASPKKRRISAARVNRLAEDGQSLLETFKNVSVSIDFSGFYTDPEVLARRERANNIALRLTDLRERLIGLQQGLDLKPSPHLDLSALLKGAVSLIKEIPRARGSLGKDLKLAKFGGFSESKLPQDHPGAVDAQRTLAQQEGVVTAFKSAQAAKLRNAAPKRAFLDSPRLPAPQPSGPVDKPLMVMDEPWTLKSLTQEQAVTDLTLLRLIRESP